MKKETKYVHFPVNMLPSFLHETDKTIKKAICYGVIRYSESIDAEIDEACKQLMYCYYREKDSLPEWLFEKIENCIEVATLAVDEDYQGFNGDTFNPELELDDLRNILEKDEEFKQSIIQFHRVRQSLWFFDLSGRISIENTINIGMKIKNNLQSKEPIVSANLDILLSFLLNKNKDENDKVQFIGFLAIKSILGEKDYVKTNKKLILARMMGYSSYSGIKPDELNESRSYLFDRFSHRYHIDNLITMLQLDWHLIAYSNKVRGIYVAIGDKVNIKDLANLVEKKKKKNRIMELKKNKNEARDEALRQLNNRNHAENTQDDDSNWF